MTSMQSNLHGFRTAKRRRFIKNHHRRHDEEGETNLSTPAACPLVAGRRSWVEADTVGGESRGGREREKRKREKRKREKKNREKKKQTKKTEKKNRGKTSSHLHVNYVIYFNTI